MPRKTINATATILTLMLMVSLTGCSFNPNSILQPSQTATQDMSQDETNLFDYLNKNYAPVTDVQFLEPNAQETDIQIYTNELLDVENVISGVVKKVYDDGLDPQTHVLVLTPKNSIEVSADEWGELQTRVHKFIDVSSQFNEQIMSSTYAYQPAVVDQDGKNSFGEVPVITFIANNYRVDNNFALTVWEKFEHTDVSLRAGNITFQYNHTGTKNTKEEMSKMVEITNEAADIIENNNLNYRILAFAYGSETAYRSADYYNDINITFLLNDDKEHSSQNTEHLNNSLINLANGTTTTLGILNEK